MEKNLPAKKGIEGILREAINYWVLTLNIQVIFSVLYISIVFLLGFYFFKYYGLQDELYRLIKISETDLELAKAGIREWSVTPNFSTFIIVTVLIRALMFPLNIGLFHIYRKIDDKEDYNISDLYEGFRGFNFFKFFGFAVFWGFISLYAHVSIVLLFVWFLVTIFAAPLMFFMNATIFESIRLTFKALRLDFFTIFVCCIVACLFSYFGFIFFFVGIVFTFPFWNAVIYSMYKKYFNEVKNGVAA